MQGSYKMLYSKRLNLLITFQVFILHPILQLAKGKGENKNSQEKILQRFAATSNLTTEKTVSRSLDTLPTGTLNG